MMEFVQAMAGKEPVVNAGDYIQDDLLYCGQCHTPKQARLELFGRVQTVSVMCKCEDEEYRKERERRQRERRYLEISEHPAMAFDLRIQSDGCHEKVKRYLQKWPDMLKKNIGLLLWGDVGTGKTSSAAYVVTQLRRAFVPCLMTSFSKLISVQNPVPALGTFDLLVLDDLGAERQSDFMLEKVYEIVNDRVNVKKPMIVTTNISLAEMKKPPELKYARLYDRILSVCVPIRFQGTSFRQNKKVQIFEEASRILGGTDE